MKPKEFKKRLKLSFSSSIRKKLIVSYVIVIVLLVSVSILPLPLYLDQIKKLNTIMDNITFANDTIVECQSLQKLLKDVLRQYTKNSNIINDISIRTQYEGSVKSINNNISIIKENNRVYDIYMDKKVIMNLDVYERMLSTYLGKAEIILSQDANISLGNRSDSYELLLIYKDAVESGNNDFISSEINFSKTKRHQINNLIATTTISTVTITFIVLVFCVLIAIYISGYMSKNIKKITDNVQLISEGNLEVPLIEVNSNDELSLLAKVFNIMTIRLKDLMEKAVHEQELLRKLEFEVLQSQINPHFLYNTLDSVVRMIGNGKNEDVISVITSLSKLFRVSLSKGKDIITIEDELEHVRSYLTIQSFRYKTRFKFNIYAQPEVLKCKTLKLILQPIVENSIYHGIQYTMDEGLIEIYGVLDSGTVFLTITDNGVGISPETLQNIFSERKNDDKKSGVALKNVRDRLTLFFGSTAGISITSVMDVGTTVKIHIPVLTNDDRDYN